MKITKKIIILNLLVFLSATLFGQGINFETGTFAETLKKAKAERKMVFIDAYAVWCGPCKRMASTVFKDKEVGDYFDKHIVALKIDVERGEGPKIEQEYAIEGLPGYLFMDPDGNVVYRAAGSMPKDDFMKIVKEAWEQTKDPMSLGRLAGRFAKEKNDEVFLKQYLDKLKETRGSKYTDILEQYLKVQKTYKPASDELIKLLMDHRKELIFGGEADRIIHANQEAEIWKTYMKGEAQRFFMSLNKDLAEQTLAYAIQKRDIGMIDVIMKRAGEVGLTVSDARRKGLLTWYYQNTGMGEEYKKMVYADLESFYNGMNIQQLQDLHRASLERVKKNPKLRLTSNTIMTCRELRSRALSFARFAVTDAEKASVVKWVKRTYDLVPDNYENVGFYANILYLFGDKKEGLRLKAEACRLAVGTKWQDAFEKDYEKMKAGEQIQL